MNFLDNFNHVIPFLIATLVALFALAHLFAYLGQRFGVSAVTRFFSLP